MDPTNQAALLWVNKTATSSSLSHSDDVERLKIFSQAQRTTRQRSTRLADKRLQRRGVGTHDKITIPEQYNAASPSVALYGFTWNAEEHRSFNYFLEQTVGQIIHLQYEHDFWVRILPCLAVNHAVVRHLIAAVASTHEFLSGRATRDADIFAMQQCNKATIMLRNSRDTCRTLVLVSCILVAAYSLLRCDITQANLVIESGLRIAGFDPDRDRHKMTEISPVAYQALDLVLARLKYKHAYRFWKPDVAFRFEMLSGSAELIDFKTDWIGGPMHSACQVAKGYKDLMAHIMSKLVRNLAVGAYIDHRSTLVKATAEQFNKLSIYARDLGERLDTDEEDQRLALKQLRVGINYAVLFLNTKIASPIDVPFDVWYETSEETLSLAQEVLAANLRGHPLIFIESIINIILFAIGVHSHSSSTRRVAVALLQQQASNENGLVYWLQGAVLKAYYEIEDDLRFPETVQFMSSPELAGPILSNVSYNHLTGIMSVEYMLLSDDQKLRVSDSLVDWNSWPKNPPEPDEIESALDGLISNHKMYSKPQRSCAPRGYIREMSHYGSRVPVFWQTLPSQDLEE